MVTPCAETGVAADSRPHTARRVNNVPDNHFIASTPTFSAVSNELIEMQSEYGDCCGGKPTATVAKYIKGRPKLVCKTRAN